MNKKMMKFSLLSVSLILTSAGAVTSAIPSMSATYATRSLSAVELLTTAPSFMVTIFVLISSFIARKIGQKQTVIIGLVIASICGILPLFSQSYSIVLAKSWTRYWLWIDQFFGSQHDCCLLSRR